MVSIRRRLFCLSLLLPLCAFALDALTRFDIPAQALPEALRLYAHQAKMQLAYKSESIIGGRSNAVVGEYDRHAALVQLLKDTGFEVVFSKGNTATIRPVQSAARGGSTAQLDEGDQGMQLAQAKSANAEAPDTNAAQAENSARPAEQADQNAKKKYAEIETIVVTAQKREERLQDVPISISVLGGAQLDQSFMPDMIEELNRVPGFSLGSKCCAGENFVALRGVSPGNSVSAGGPTVSFYLDGMPFVFSSTAFAPNLNVYDLDRIEMLRGPQGTLYGASALNGVVRVLTRDANPDRFEFKARTWASATEGGDESYRGDVAINVPIVDGKLAVRAVAGYEHQGGWADRASKENANSAQLGNARIKFSAQPTEQLSIDLSAWRWRDDRDGHAIHSDEPSLFEEPSRHDYGAYGLTIGYDFPSFSVASTTSYLDYDWNTFVDLTVFGLPFRNALNFGLKTFVQEILFNSTHEGPWRWSVGAIYRDGEDRRGPQGIENLFAVYDKNTYTSRSYALFGELTRLFLDGQLEFTAGLRYFEDDVSLRELSRAPNGVPPEQLVEADEKFDATTPRLVLTWHPREQMTVYGSYSEGFRSGQIQQPANLVQFGRYSEFPPTLPDELTNYEVGAKGSLWGGRLDYETALYYIDWQNVQQLLQIINPDGMSLGAVVNSESASGIGVDFGVMMRPADRFELGLSFNWNDLTFDADVLSAGNPLYFKGERMPFSIEYSVAASADYVLPLGSNGYEGRLSASVNLQSPNPQQAIQIGAGERLPRGRSESLWFARSSVSVSAPQHWTVTVFADNINNEQGLITAFPLAGFPWEARPRPRTVGLQLEYQF